MCSLQLAFKGERTHKKSLKFRLDNGKLHYSENEGCTMSGIDIQARFREACVRTDAVIAIVGLQLSSPCQIDPSMNNNEALITAVTTQNADLIRYLLTDIRVLKFEQENNFPALRAAIEKKSFYVFVIVNALNAKEIALPPEIVALMSIQTVGENATNYTNDTPRNQPQGSALRFSQFGGSVQFEDDYASATGEYKRRGWRRFICGG